MISDDMSAAQILKQLDSRQLRERLGEIEEERKAIMVLLRAIETRERREKGK